MIITIELTQDEIDILTEPLQQLGMNEGDEVAEFLKERFSKDVDKILRDARIVEVEALVQQIQNEPLPIELDYNQWLPAGTLITHNGVEYIVVQGHRPQPDWNPADLPALYTPVPPDENGHPIWVQPTGAHDAYPLDAIVSHNGILYISLHSANVWEPPTQWAVYEP